MSKKNRRKHASASGAGPLAETDNTDPPPTESHPAPADVPSSVHSVPGTVATEAHVSGDSEEDKGEVISDPTSLPPLVPKSDSDAPKAMVSGKPEPIGKKKRNPLNSSDSSDENTPIGDLKKLAKSSKSYESPVKKRKFSEAEYQDVQQSSSSGEPDILEQDSDCVVSNIKYTVSTPVGDYMFYGPRREFTVIDLKNSKVFNDLYPYEPAALPPAYLALLEHLKDSFLLSGYQSSFPNRNESAYRNHQMNYLFYLSEERRRFCDTDTDNLHSLPHNIESGMKRALAAAVDTIKDSLIYRTRAEEDNVFNNEFYISLCGDGYKPYFSNTKIYQQESLSESLLRFAILLLALADSAMNNIRLVAGIGYCYIAHVVITTFRKLCLLEQPYKVLDHVIRQKVSAAVYAVELYTKKNAGIVEKPFDDVCKSLFEITFTMFFVTKDRIKWKMLKSFTDHAVTEPEFLAFTDEMINPYVHWTIDEHLAWTTDVATSIRTARRMSILIENFEATAKILKKDFDEMLKHYGVLGYFDIDHDDHENKHAEALVSSFRGLSLAPLLECMKSPEQADDFASQVAADLTIACEAERASETPDPIFFKQLVTEKMLFTLLRLFYHMWEIHKPKDVTRIRLKLLGVRQVAESLCSDLGENGSFPAIVALSSIMYMDYTCGMVSMASEISIKETRRKCHDLAEDYLSNDEEVKDTCLSFLIFKMEEIQRTIITGRNNAESNFERGCRILKIATLAYPVLFYFYSKPAEIDMESCPETEDPVDESYKRKSRRCRLPINGQKLLYLQHVPYYMNKNIIKAEFLKLEEETYADAIERKKKRALAPDSEDSVTSDSDEDDEWASRSSSEEQGNDLLFHVTLKQSGHKYARGSSSNAKHFPNIQTRATMAAALDQFIRPEEAQGVMLEPLRSESPTTSDEYSDSRPVSRQESDTSNSESSSLRPDEETRNKTFEKIKKFRPIDLENFYKSITHGTRGYPMKTFDFGSSTFEEVFAQTLVNFPDNTEDKFKDSLATVLRSLQTCIYIIL